MRIGKVKESTLNRSVLRQIKKKTSYGSPKPGEDAGFLDIKDQTFCISTNPVEGWTLAAERIVFGVVNRMLAVRAKPICITLSILMPEEAEEKQLKQLMNQIAGYCEKEHITVAAGHTAVSPFVKDLIVSGTALGVPEYFQEKREEAHLYPGLDLVVAGHIGREGTAMLAHKYGLALKERYPASFVNDASALFFEASMSEMKEILLDENIIKIHDLSEGGVFAGLWEMAAADKAGIHIDLKHIPIKQHTIEVCEFFNLNPYMLRSCGSLLIATKNGEKVVREFEASGINAAIIGKTTDSNDRIIAYDDEIRFLEPPKTDEYYKTIRMTQYTSQV